MEYSKKDSSIFQNKRGNIVIGLIVALVLALVFAGVLNLVKPCTDFGLSFTGFLLMIVAIIFGVQGNLVVGGISGTGFLVFLFLSFHGCLPKILQAMI